MIRFLNHPIIGLRDYDHALWLGCDTERDQYVCYARRITMMHSTATQFKLTHLSLAIECLQCIKCRAFCSLDTYLLYSRLLCIYYLSCIYSASAESQYLILYYMTYYSDTAQLFVTHINIHACSWYFLHIIHTCADFTETWWAHLPGRQTHACSSTFLLGYGNHHFYYKYI